MKRKWVIVSCVPAMVAATFVSACSDDDNTPLNLRDGGRDTSTSTPDTSTPDTGLDAGESLTFTKYASFDAAAGQLPEGIVLSNGTPIVTFAPLGKIVRVPPNGALEDFASFGAVDKSNTLGLALDPTSDAGALFVAVASYAQGAAPAPGIYKTSLEAGAPPNRFDLPFNANVVFPNGFDLIGTDLFVSESAGLIYKVAPSGQPEVWIMGDPLGGDITACGGSKNTFPIGVNGLAHDDAYLYGVNHDRGLFFRIPRVNDGGGGNIEVLIQDCAFAGADGIVRDTDGTIIVANNTKNRIDRVTISGANATYKTIASGAPLDGPASVLIEGTAPNKRLWITNSAFGTSSVDAAAATPSLLTAPIK